MSVQKQPQVYIKTYQLLKELHEVVRNMPKHYKYTLGESSLELAWRCLDLIVEANFYYNTRIKRDRITELSLTFDKLKLRLRMLNELKLINLKKYRYLQFNYVNSIGEMIGGWKKWVNS